MASAAQGAIVHSMAEFISTPTELVPAWDWLEREGLSVHALIYPDGTILRGATDDDVAYHAGKSQLGELDNLNSAFLGAEFLVRGQHTYTTFLHAIAQPETYTDQQYEAGAQLYADWHRRHHFPLSHIVAHSAVSSDAVRGAGKGKRDPGAGFDWPRFLTAIQDRLAVGQGAIS